MLSNAQDVRECLKDSRPEKSGCNFGRRQPCQRCQRLCKILWRVYAVATFIEF